ncbi:MAG: class I SAM-dependent methyltransferase [Bradymonadaceae bacterium]
MNCCGHCADAGELFDWTKAEEELCDYRRDGLSKSSAELLVGGLRSLALEGRRLLDIGGGVGTIPFELSDEGIAEATLVEASAPYLEVARAEAGRRALAEWLTCREGDVCEMADDLDSFDVVTLDRAICCYPHMERLVEVTTDLADEYYGVVYPRENLFSKSIEKLADVYCRLKGMDFRLYIHEGIDETIRECGFEPFYDVTTWLWRVTLYEASR